MISVINISNWQIMLFSFYEKIMLLTMNIKFAEMKYIHYFLFADSIQQIFNGLLGPKLKYYRALSGKFRLLKPSFLLPRFIVS